LEFDVLTTDLNFVIFLVGKVLLKWEEHFRNGLFCMLNLNQQEAFEKCLAHSPLRAAARGLFYIAIHQVSLLSHAACASMSTTTTTTRDRGDRYGPIEWTQSVSQLKWSVLPRVWSF